MPSVILQNLAESEFELFLNKGQQFNIVIDVYPVKGASQISMASFWYRGGELPHVPQSVIAFLVIALLLFLKLHVLSFLQVSPWQRRSS